nr:beta-1,3-galactosyltransferase 5-like [Dermacentor andersoni]
MVFFVGQTSQRNEHEAVSDEAIHEGDVVVLNFTDTYKNLTHKFLLGAKWVYDNCRLDSAVTIVKLDDDVLVNVFALLSYLKSGVMALTGFHCKVLTGAVPYRTRKSKWVSMKASGIDRYQLTPERLPLVSSEKEAPAQTTMIVDNHMCAEVLGKEISPEECHNDVG